MSPLVLDRDKAIAVIIFFLEKVDNITRSQLCELSYQADRLHLSMYGRMITNEQYTIEHVGIIGLNLLELLEPLTAEDRVMDPDELSISDLDCLTVVVDLFNKADNPDYSDTYPDVVEGEYISLLDIVSTLPDPNDLKEHVLSR